MNNLAAIPFLRNSFLKTKEMSFHLDDVGRNIPVNDQNFTQCDEMPDYFVPEDSFESLPDWSEALFAVGNIIVLISSICGNIGALLVLYKSQVSKRSTKLFLVSLATCDLSLTLSSPTVDLSQLLSRYQSWIFGEFLCKVFPFIQTAAVMGVGLFLVAIADWLAERYMYVVRSFESPISMVGSPWRDFYASITVATVWIFAILIGLPNLWYYKRDSFWTYIIVNGERVRPRNETCKMYYICLRSSFDTSNIAYYSFLGMAILIPTICFIFCYISIIIFVRRHVNVMTKAATNTTTTFPSQAPGPEQRIARNKKTLRLILGLILLNLTCRLPVWLFIVITNVKETPVNTMTLFMLYGFHLLSNINCVINPFVYAIFNDSIRSTRGRGTNCGRTNDAFPEERSSCCNFMSWSCCYHKIKASSVEYFLERKGKQNNYDFTTKNNSKFLPSISTQRFNLSDKNEFTPPKLSSVTTTINNNSSS